MRITKNPKWSEEQHAQFAQKIKENDGYCPCSLIKNDDTKCMCKAFIEQSKTGLCHCGRYLKTEV